MADDPPNHFFKFIKPGSKFNISIPKSFWTTLNREACNKAILRRGRHEWPVDISDQGVFGDGYRKFVTDNRVQEFDLIVFENQGNMVFDFMVFDPSTCEREYPNLLDEMDVKEPLTESGSTHVHERLKKVKKRKRNDYSSVKEDKIQLGGDSSFVTIMTPDYIKSSRLYVPMKFATSNGLITKKTQNEIVHTQIVLIDEAERTWPATLQTSSRRVFLVGWNELKIKNHLKAGDSCMFELVKLGAVPVFSFYKLGKKPTTYNIQTNKETSFSLNQETSSTHNNHRYFISTLKPCTFKKACLYLPVEFSIPNGLKIGEMILRDDKGRSWKLQLNKNAEKSFYLRSGLKEFCDANGLKEGDAYKFELIENEKDKPPVVNFSLDVDMTRDVEEPPRESDSIHKVSSFEDLDVEEPLTESDSNYTHKRSKKLKKHKRRDYLSQNKDNYQLGKDRSFMAVMTPYYIKASILHVPMKFGRSNGFITKRSQTQIVHKQIVITDEAERTWPATLKVRSTKIRLTNWRELKIENNLEVGDACKFELVKHGEVPVFNFYNLGKKPLMNNMETGSKDNKATNSIHNNHHYFISTLNHNSIRKSGLYLPVKFYISSGLTLGETILRYDKGRSWKVRLIKHGEKAFSLGRGFIDFCNANGLKEGYAYKFEIVENEKDKPPVMNVSLNVDLTPSRKKNYPYFIGEVKSYFIEKLLYLPTKFARNNGLFNKEEMILKNVKNDGSWTVKLKSSINNKCCHIGRGWKEFQVANGLKEGDLFKLELVENGEKPIANFYFQNIR